MAPFDFLTGHPNRSLLPVGEIRNIFSLMAASEDCEDLLANALNYGMDEGDLSLREEILAFLERQCANDEGAPENYKPSPSQLFITGGISHGMELILSALAEPGDLIMCEDPTYFLVTKIFCSHALKVAALPMRDVVGGIDVELLELELQSGQRKVPRFLYLIPLHQNPTGYSMNVEDRKRLARLVNEYEILLLADEVYHFLDWRTSDDEPRPCRMATLNTRNNNDKQKRPSGCISLNAFTKIFGPGVRLGWVEAPASIIQSLTRVGYIQSQGGVAPLMGEIMRRALVMRTVDTFLESLCTRLSRRSQIICEELQQEPRIKILFKPLGGYFIWIHVPLNDATHFWGSLLNDNGVRLLPGYKCTAVSESGEKSRLAPYARLCFAYLDEQDLRNGAKLLVHRFQEYMQDIEKQRIDA